VLTPNVKEIITDNSKCSASFVVQADDNIYVINKLYDIYVITLPENIKFSGQYHHPAR
jgi:hypothetical protein